MTMPDPTPDPAANDTGTRACDNCEGRFLPEDMEGDHCSDCAEELFGDDR